MADFGIQQAMIAQQQHQSALLQMQARQKQMGVGIPIDMVKNGSVPAGSLIIADNFQPANPTDKFAHGEMVGMSATRDGFKGPVLTQAQAPSSQLSRAMTLNEQELFNPKQTPEQTRANLASLTTNNALYVLDAQTRMVNGADVTGARNSVLNISQGGSPASVSEQVYATASMAWEPKASPEAQASGLTVTKNLAAAYGLNVDNLTSKDPKVFGPERVKLQEALMKATTSASDNSPEVAKAKQAFATAVGRFESRNNSVVISSGNEGDVLDFFKKDAGGLAPGKIPKNFTTNFLDTPEATMVGATRWSDNGGKLTERVAEYSNQNSGVDIYASGALRLEKGQDPVHGTSFAAPRVAATMAALHKQNPRMSSSQIEALMNQSLTHQLEGTGGVSVLDFQKSSDFMVGR